MFGGPWQFVITQNMRQEIKVKIVCLFIFFFSFFLVFLVGNIIHWDLTFCTVDFE